MPNNVEGALFYVMAKLGYFEDDSRIALDTTAKLWSDPAEIYARMAEM